MGDANGGYGRGTKFRLKIFIVIVVRARTNDFAAEYVRYFVWSLTNTNLWVGVCTESQSKTYLC